MKKTLLMLAMGLLLASCSNDDEPTGDTPETELDFSQPSAIVGTWHEAEKLIDGQWTYTGHQEVIEFTADGKFDYWWGTNQQYHTSGTYTYANSTATGTYENSVGNKHNVTFKLAPYADSETTYRRYRVTITINDETSEYLFRKERE